MKRDSDYIKIILFMLAVLLLSVVALWCAFGGDGPEVIGAELVRVSAPVDTYEDDVNVRREGTPIPQSPAATAPFTQGSLEKRDDVVAAEIASVSAAAPEVVAVDVYELMWRTPLRTEVQMMIEDVCAARDVDVRVVLAIIEVESEFDERAVGDSCQSYGLMQVQPRWHGERMLRLGATDLLDGVQNVLVGIDYLDELLDRYGGDYYKAVTAYNKGHWPGYVTSYAYKVMAIAGEVR